MYHGHGQADIENNYYNFDLVGLFSFKYDLIVIITDHLILDLDFRFRLALDVFGPRATGPMGSGLGSI